MFQSARLKLTTWYLLIIMFVSIAFSAVIYRLIINEVERFVRMQRSRIERRYPFSPLPIIDTELVEEIEQRLLLRLAIVNGSIFVMSGLLGYVLAGRTLRPIKIMLDDQHRFITDASHELRTPLTSLKTTLEVNLRDPKLTLKDSKKLIEENIEEVDKLQLLTDGLLELTQYQNPKGTVQLEPISIREVITKSIRKILPLARKKKISIKSDIQDVQVTASFFSLVDLFVIFLDNAVKYSPEGSIVTIKNRTTNGYVEISITDRGFGIDKIDLPHIFDRFYRAETSRTKLPESGYGLGLSIAQKIVDLHSGSIEVESIPYKGSIFTVRLPKKSKKEKWSF